MTEIWFATIICNISLAVIPVMLDSDCFISIKYGDRLTSIPFS